MTIIDSLILGVVEGFTEFLPISSTGHLILTSTILGLQHDVFLKSFEIVIQLGAIASVVFLYWRSFLDVGTLKKLIVAFIPTGVIGLLFYKIIKTYLMGNTSVVLWSLFIGGIAIIIFEYWYQKRIDSTKDTNLSSHHSRVDIDLNGDKSLSRRELNIASVKDVSNISYNKAIAIGIFQSIAMIPGVSRSAATIIGGLFMGIDRRTIVEFSFLLAVPTMLIASGLDLAKNYSVFTGDQFWLLLIGFVSAFIVAMFSIKFLLKFIQKRSFVAFGIYRIAVAVLFWFIIF